MASYNHTTLVGNLTRNPEIRYLPSGMAVCSLGLAVNNTFKRADGEAREDVLFIDITVFGKQAEPCGQYLHKGSSVLVAGRLQLDSWEDKNGGGKRSKIKLIADRVQFLSKDMTSYDSNSDSDSSDDSPNTKDEVPF